MVYVELITRRCSCYVSRSRVLCWPRSLNATFERPGSSRISPNVTAAICDEPLRLVLKFPSKGAEEVTLGAWTGEQS